MTWSAALIGFPLVTKIRSPRRKQADDPDVLYGNIRRMRAFELMQTAAQSEYCANVLLARQKLIVHFRRLNLILSPLSLGRRSAMQWSVEFLHMDCIQYVQQVDSLCMVTLDYSLRQLWRVIILHLVDAIHIYCLSNFLCYLQIISRKHKSL